MGTVSKHIKNVSEHLGDRVGSLRHSVGDKIEGLSEAAAEKSGEEGRLTRTIEQITAALPSTTWLMLAGASIAGSISLKVMGRHQTANFVGQWAPTFLILGLYNKLVKVAGSDRTGAL